MKYKLQGKQFILYDFRSSLADLLKFNRQGKLGYLLTCLGVEKTYNSKLNNCTSCVSNKSTFLIVGGFITKHKMCLSDRKTIWTIQENPHIQNCLNLSEFTDEHIFAPILAVTICKRTQIEDFIFFTVKLLIYQKKGYTDNFCKQTYSELKNEINDKDGFKDTQNRVHKGDFRINAICNDAEKCYSTDIDLLNDGRLTLNRYFNKICNKLIVLYPMTFIKQFYKDYLNVIKHKKKRKKLANKCKSKIFAYLSWVIRSLTYLVVIYGSQLLDIFKKNEKRALCSINNMVHQQQQRFNLGVHTDRDRIISVIQPHICPLFSGKSKTHIEFGTRIKANIVSGYTLIEHQTREGTRIKNQQILNYTLVFIKITVRLSTG